MASQRHKVVEQGVAADGRQVAEGEAAHWAYPGPGWPTNPADTGQVIRITDANPGKVFLDATDYPKFADGDKVVFVGTAGAGGTTFEAATYTLGTANASEKSFVLRNEADDADVNLSTLAADLRGGTMTIAPVEEE